MTGDKNNNNNYNDFSDNSNGDKNINNIDDSVQEGAIAGKTAAMPLLGYSPAALAYLGDAVIELWVRERLVRSGLPGSRELNAKALEYVTAPMQAAATKKILPLLDEDEAAVFRRGRNIGHTNLPKKATAGEYRTATGLEALFGWLHLSGRTKRISELLEAGYGEPREKN